MISSDRVNLISETSLQFRDMIRKEDTSPLTTPSTMTMSTATQEMVRTSSWEAKPTMRINTTKFRNPLSMISMIIWQSKVTNRRRERRRHCYIEKDTRSTILEEDEGVMSE